MLHVTANLGPFQCLGPGMKRSFILPKKYKQYQTSDNTREEEDNYDDDSEVDNDGTHFAANAGEQRWRRNHASQQDLDDDDNNTHFSVNAGVQRRRKNQVSQ